MTLPQAAFAAFAAAALASAALAVTGRNLVHCLLWVLSLFLCVAGLFLLAGAQFLAAVQVILYAGAILVFFLIVLMLLDLPLEETERRFGRHAPWAAALSSALGLLGLAGLRAALPPSAAPAEPSTAALGAALYGEYALPFEAASLVLLAAIIGAVVLARRGPEEG